MTVSVAGERREITVRVDADHPVGAYLGQWARQCSGLDPRDVVLVDSATGAVVGPDDTLGALRIGYGSRLRLVSNPDRAPGDARAGSETTGAAAAGPEGPVVSGGSRVAAGGDGVVAPSAAAPDESTAPASGASGSSWPGAPRPEGVGPPEPGLPPAAMGGLARRVRAARAAVRRQDLPAPEAFAVPERLTAAGRWRASLEETDRNRQLEGLVRSATLTRTSVVAIVSPKGGVGKSTLTALAGTLLAELRSEPVICVDANPDFGNLADKLSAPSANRGARTDELQAYLAGRGQVTPAELNQHLGIGPHGVRFVASPTGDPHRMIAAADLGLYQDLIHRLQAYAGVILLDCGTGFLDAPVRAALGAATEIILVTDSSADTARLVVGAAGYLPRSTPVWLAANKMPRRGSRVDLDAVRQALVVQDLVVIPERPLAENVVGPHFAWGSAPAVWQRPLRELLASLASAWPRRAGHGLDIGR